MFQIKTFGVTMLLVGCIPLVASSQTPKDKEIVVTITTKPAPSGEPFSGVRPTVDVALLLDTSNSMDGLISQAKNQLWTIVRQFAKAKREGKTPRLRVALFEYGNTGLPASEGYIRQVVPLTDNLDELSEALFGLSTNGGDEYCGQVIDEACKRLDWCREPNTYKAIFIAGNEPFTQGSVDYRDACRKAIQSGVIVNTIHCGDRNSGISGKWKDGADLAEGKFFNIDQDRTIVHVHCPQDEIILKLNAQLNETYLWFGSKGEREATRARQEGQDRSASREGSSTAVERVAAKATSIYNNAERDLVDYVAQNPNAAVGDLEAGQLPVEMQNMNEQERKDYVEKFAARRKDLQAQIARLTREREEYVAQQQQHAGQDAPADTLGDAVVTAIADQLSTAGYSIEE